MKWWQRYRVKIQIHQSVSAFGLNEITEERFFTFLGAKLWAKGGTANHYWIYKRTKDDWELVEESCKVVREYQIKNVGHTRYEGYSHEWKVLFSSKWNEY